MIDGTPGFDGDIFADALSKLGQVAHEAGRVIDIALYGGSCLMLVSNFRLARRCGRVAADDQGFLDLAVRAVA